MGASVDERTEERALLNLPVGQWTHHGLADRTMTIELGSGLAPNESMLVLLTRKSDGTYSHTEAFIGDTACAALVKGDCEAWAKHGRLRKL